ncbi:MAG: DUF1772 domain-containing protein [Hyphomicrobiales bacterium]|nr:MAG: DUF1772 domain-containing protein [Hyphomicrobiales bacterium]
MLEAIINFAALLLAALLVGSMFSVWLIFDPAGLDGATYVTQQQLAIRTLNVSLPILGATTLLATIVEAALARGTGLRFGLVLAAVIAIALAGLITRFANQPINALVAAWKPEMPPLDWTQWRDTWWHWHLARLVCGLAGLSCLISATLVDRS